MNAPNKFMVEMPLLVSAATAAAAGYYWAFEFFMMLDDAPLCGMEGLAWIFIWFVWGISLVLKLLLVRFFGYKRAYAYAPVIAQAAVSTAGVWAYTYPCFSAPFGCIFAYTAAILGITETSLALICAVKAEDK